jgi:hypothetical protein
MSMAKIQKWWDIESLLGKKIFILWLAFANVINNTQKVSYSYVHSSFENYDSMNWFLQCSSWFMVLLGVVSIELSILVFVSRGSKKLGMFFAILIFLLNFNYLVPNNIFDLDFTLSVFRDLVKNFIIALLSPVIVYFFSEMYVKENTDNQRFLVKKEQVSRIIKLLRVKIHRLRVELYTKEKDSSNLEVSKNELIVSLQKQLQDKSNSLSKCKNDLSNIEVELDAIRVDKKKVEEKLFTYVQKFTCDRCGEVFESQFALRGHKSQNNCVPL